MFPIVAEFLASPLHRNHLRAVTKVLVDKQWNMKCKKLVEFGQKNGHCMVPRSHKKDKSLIGRWVERQQTFHSSNDKI
jgi:hypothetical protein